MVIRIFLDQSFQFLVSTRARASGIIAPALPDSILTTGRTDILRARAVIQYHVTVFPDADLFNLSPEQREAVIENFVALDIYQRMALDIGRTIQERAPTATVGVARLKEVRDYIKQTVAASFRNLRTSGNTINSGKISQVVRAALEETFQVFEAYTK